MKILLSARNKFHASSDDVFHQYFPSRRVSYFPRFFNFPSDFDFSSKDLFFNLVILSDIKTDDLNASLIKCASQMQLQPLQAPSVPAGSDKI